MVRRFPLCQGVRASRKGRRRGSLGRGLIGVRVAVCFGHGKSNC